MWKNTRDSASGARPADPPIPGVGPISYPHPFGFAECPSIGGTDRLCEGEPKVAGTYDPIELELFKNAIFSIAEKSWHSAQFLRPPGFCTA